ncbi:MAG TPA: transposase [Longimicrobiaceae bacterium]|nr:transposase [Longimicrobiaceae bacterium]
MVVCARLAEGEQVRRRSERFGTTTREPLRLLEWLRSMGVTRVGMESTGVYRKPVWQVLEWDSTRGLGNARAMRHVPGRKSDRSDASRTAGIEIAPLGT